MKTIILFLLICLPIVSVSQFTLGLRTGLNHSSLLLSLETEINESTQSYLDADNSIIGFYIGPTLTYQLREHVQLVGELQFNVRGHNIDKSLGSSRNYKFRQVNAVLYGRAQLFNLLYLDIGYEGTRSFGRLSKWFWKWDHSVLAGISIPMGDRLIIESRYVRGFKTIGHINFIDIHGGSTGLGTAKSHVIQLGIAYKI